MVFPVSVLTRRALVTSRSTSVLRSCTRAMPHPSRRGARSRTIVSTSGSSGTLDLAPGDVSPPGLALESDLLGCRAAGRRGERHARTETGDVQDAAAGGPQRAIGCARRAGVKDDDVVSQVGCRRDLNRRAFLRMVGIAACGDRKSVV